MGRMAAMLLRYGCAIFGVNLLLFAVYSEQAAKPQPQGAGLVQFTNVTAQAGITFRHNSGASAEKHMFETFGSGVGVIDFDNDGLPDLYFANGADAGHGKSSFVAYLRERRDGGGVCGAVERRRAAASGAVR